MKTDFSKKELEVIAEAVSVYQQQVGHDISRGAFEMYAAGTGVTPAQVKEGLIKDVNACERIMNKIGIITAVLVTCVIFGCGNLSSDNDISSSPPQNSI